MQRKKGISLIVLVITIIVMIILAGAIILSLNNAGIIGKASEAVEKTNLKQVQTLAQLKWSEAYLRDEKQLWQLKKAVREGLTAEGINIEEYDIKITTKGTTVAVKENIEVVSGEITGNETFQGEEGPFKYVKLSNGDIQITRYTGDKTEVTIPATYDGYDVYALGNIEADTHNSNKLYNIFGETNSMSNATVTSVTISDGIKEIQPLAFYSCTALESLTLSNTLENIGLGAFMLCSGLDGTLTLPSTLETIGRAAFTKCTSLTGDLQIPEGITQIGASTFSGCSGLDGTLTLPSTLETIGQFAFNGCSGLTGNLTIPNSVTVIETAAFQQCDGFTGSLNIPESITTIGPYGFYS